MERALEDAVTVLYAACAPDREPCEAKFFPWWLLRRTHVQILRSQLSKKYAPATANRILTAVKGVLTECRRAKMISADDLFDARDVKRVKGSRELTGRALSNDEIRSMFSKCITSTWTGCRNRCVISLLRRTGLRREEATNLELGSYAHGELRIIGKGNKERLVHVNRALAQDLAAWIVFRGNAPGPLFFAATPQGRMSTKRLSYSGMQKIVLDIAKEAGLEDVSMHDFRRTLISELLDQGNDIATVSKIVGHANASTTAKYDRRGIKAAIKALENDEI